MPDWRQYFDSPEFNLTWELEKLIDQTKRDCGTYTDLGPSGHDNHLGYTEYDLKKYKLLLLPRIRQFRKDHKTEIKKLNLQERVTRIIKEAKAFSGETVYKVDPRASPGRNHHTGRENY